MKLHEEFKLYENMWDDSDAVSESSTPSMSSSTYNVTASLGSNGSVTSHDCSVAEAMKATLDFIGNAQVYYIEWENCTTGEIDLYVDGRKATSLVQSLSQTADQITDKARYIKKGHIMYN